MDVKGRMSNNGSMVIGYVFSPTCVYGEVWDA